MIITETTIINSKEFAKHYSNEGYMIQKVGTEEIYFEAVDPVNIFREYVETDILIESTEEFSDAEFRTMVEEAL